MLKVSLPPDHILAISISPSMVLVLSQAFEDMYIARWSTCDEFGLYTHFEAVMYDREFAFDFAYLMTENVIFEVLL